MVRQLKLLIHRPAITKENLVQYWRERVFNSLTLFFVIIGSIILIPTVLAAVERGYWGVIVLEVMTYATLLFNFFFLKVSFTLRVWFFFVMMYVLGVGVEILLGPYGSGLICLFVIPILAAILLGYSSAVFAIVLNTLSFVTLGILLQQKLLANTLLSIYDTTGWSIISINFACVSTVITLSVAIMVHRIELGLMREKQVILEKQAETEKLKKVNAELDRFVYSASHDLRAPVTSLQGLINIYYFEKNELQREELLKMMSQRVDKMNEFISQIIHYSWNSRTEIGSEVINFTSLVNGVLDNLQFNEGYKETHVQTEIYGHADFYSDKNRLQLILNNILSNCFRYRNPQTQSIVNITIEKKEDAAYIHIMDNGKGIMEQHLPHLTKMFYRATDENPGSGLGLFIVKETLDTLNGSISISSELKKSNQCKTYYSQCSHTTWPVKSADLVIFLSKKPSVFSTLIKDLQTIVYKIW